MVREKTDVSGEFVSSPLSEACGVEVTINFSGSVMDLKFPDRPVGPQDITIGNVVWVATAGDKKVRFQNVGTEVTQLKPDGTMIYTVTGHHPAIGEVIGVVKTNLDTGETILESPHVNDIGKLCKQLTG